MGQLHDIGPSRWTVGETLDTVDQERQFTPEEMTFSAQTIEMMDLTRLRLCRQLKGQSVSARVKFEN
jgi:hypothetical protein